MLEHYSYIPNDGKITIPASIRNAAGLKKGDRIVIYYENNEVKITNFDQLLLKSRSILKPYLKDDVNLVDELIKDRKAESD